MLANEELLKKVRMYCLNNYTKEYDNPYNKTDSHIDYDDFEHGRQEVLKELCKILELR